MKNGIQTESRPFKKRNSNHLARLEEFFLLKEFEQANKKYETNPEFRAEVDEACASFIKNRHAEEQQV